MKMMYVIAWNTGDEYWDNNPIVEVYETIEELIDAIHNEKEEIDNEQIERIEKGEEVYDYSEEVWCVYKR